MATYEEIYGKRVEVLDADPSLTSAQEGQVWYNSTSGTLKSVVSFASWASATNMTQARTSIMGNVGTQTASLIGGGETPSSPGTNLTEEYNGLGWSSGGNRATSFFRVANFGTQTAAVGFSGYNPSSIPTAPARYSISTEEYDGSSWTAGGSFPEGIQTAGATGTLTAGLQASGIFGPYTTAPSSGWETTCNEYDGSSWTNGTAMPMGRDISTDIGTLTAALMTCGREGPPGTNIKSTFHYDGTNWTASTDAPTAGHGCMGFGTQTSAILCGGAAPSRSTQSILWDGTSWATSGSLGTAKVYGMSAGTTTAGMTCAGGTPSVPSGDNQTEEYSVSINTITAAAWASGTSVNTARYAANAAGPSTAGLYWGGQTPGDTQSLVEEYDGSTWTEVNNTPSGTYASASFGTQTAAVSAGGAPPTSGNLNTSYEYDGTNWTSGNTINTARRYLAGFGILTAGVIAGGFVPPASSATENYNGTNWTTAPNSLNAARDRSSATGTNTAGLFCAGTPGDTNSEEWNGTAWTAGNTMLFGAQDRGCAGSQTDALFFGDSPPSANTEGYDGTNFSTRPSMGTARGIFYTGGTPNASATGAWAGAGYTSTAVANVEEYSTGTETATASTLTTS